MSARFDKQLDDFFKWYNFHKEQIPRDNLTRRMDFYDKMLANMFLLLKIAAEDLEMLEGPRRQLWLPSGMEVKGDVTKFG